MALKCLSARSCLAIACLLTASAGVHAIDAAPDAAASAAAVQRVRDTQATRAWAWRAPAQDAKPVFHGVVSYDNAGGGAGTMMYPAPNAAGLLIAILTHAALNEGTRSAEAKRLEEQADKVLEPLKAPVDRLLLRQVQGAALARLEMASAPRLIEPADEAAEAWVIETQPVFLMSQDQRALLVETLVRVFDGAAKTALLERAVRVVSPPVKAQDAQAYWLDADGSRLAATSAALLAEAVRVALLDVQASGELSQRTVRYVEGSADRFERAMPLSERCERVALRTLRGAVMSVPVRPKGAAPDAAGTGASCGMPWPEAGAEATTEAQTDKPAAQPAS
jgi:hypothetical protein